MTKKSTKKILVIALGFILFVLVISLYTQQALAVCVKDSEVCVEGAETRIVNGLEITRDCWRFASQYTCSGTELIPDSHCQDLIDQGCSPVSQECDETSCVVTYECIENGAGSIQTGQGCDDMSVNVGGIEFDTSYEPSQDFGKAASNMEALESAVTGMVKDDASCVEEPANSGKYVCAEAILIFNGSDMKCRKDSLGFNKCCSLKGWGEDTGLTQCNQEEVTLGYARQAGRTHYIGKYCTHSNAFGCYAHAYVYCVFSSKIGRIVQEQGRVQLSKGWGSAKKPQCTGFTPDELQLLDFELIDFSEYFADAFADTNAPPSSNEMKGIIDTYIQTLQSSSGG
jgi:conjugal transfer mating pair stabilization protein TraN